jgi:DNA polymerase
MTNEEKLRKLYEQIKKCKRCPLYKTATNAVPGEGSADAKLMFVGEAPGRNEDETGKPFVGRAGKLLTRLIEGIGMSRAQVFITSVVKHRPPKNRPPKPLEVNTCKHWLNEQLTIVKPKLIVPLGRFGMEYFLPGETITSAHGRLFNQPRWNVFPVYHPAYGLRSTRALEAIKRDFKSLKAVLLKERILGV